MHVDTLRLILGKYKTNMTVMTQWFRKFLLGDACGRGNVEIVQELLDNHQDMFGDWTVHYFNYAAMKDNVPVMRMLSLTPNGLAKLVQDPPQNRACTIKLLIETYLNSSVTLMLCVKRLTTPEKMAKLLDPLLRDLISGDLLRYEMEIKF